MRDAFRPARFGELSKDVMGVTKTIGGEDHRPDRHIMKNDMEKMRHHSLTPVNNKNSQKSALHSRSHSQLPSLSGTHNLGGTHNFGGTQNLGGTNNFDKDSLNNRTQLNEGGATSTINLSENGSAKSG